MWSSMHVGICGGRMKGTDIVLPETPVWIPNTMLAEESMQSPKELNSMCSVVRLHSGIDFSNFLIVTFEYCGGRWSMKA